ncbi:MAG TPA: PRC-barrel domain-containing protein [bacterium]|nr:PRC-barrel domain-containing protein [bacterium]
MAPEPTTKKALYRLGDMNLVVADRSQDIRGRKVVDRAGEEMGTVEDLLVDDREQKVRFMEVGTGGFLGLGETKFLMPIDAITRIETDTITVDQTRERVAGAPRYAPELISDQRHWEELYGYYGYAPFWGPDYVYPLLPPSSAAPAAQHESSERVTGHEHRKATRAPAKSGTAPRRDNLRTGAGRSRRGGRARQGRG